MVMAPRPILATVSLKETKCRRAAEFTWGSMAAMTCGMPEPEAPGKKRRVAQTMKAVSVGVQSSTHHG